MNWLTLWSAALAGAFVNSVVLSICFMFWEQYKIRRQAARVARAMPLLAELNSGGIVTPEQREDICKKHGFKLGEDGQLEDLRS